MRYQSNSFCDRLYLRACDRLYLRKLTLSCENSKPRYWNRHRPGSFGRDSPPGYVQLYAIGEPQIEKANQLAAEFGAERTEADYRHPGRPGRRRRSHCTPNALHFPIAKDALQGRKHVICEKPWPSVARARELVKLAADANGAIVPSRLRSTDGAHAPHGQMATSARSGGTRHYSRTGCSTCQIGTGGWTPNSTAHAASPISARTGATWPAYVTGQHITSVCADGDLPPNAQRQRPIETFAGKRSSRKITLRLRSTP